MRGAPLVIGKSKVEIVIDGIDLHWFDKAAYALLINLKNRQSLILNERIGKKSKLAMPLTDNPQT